MNCYTVDGKGLSGLQVTDVPAPQPPKRGEVLIDVHAVSLNYRDIMVADGRYGGEQSPPIIACSDMAGVVRQVGSDVSGLKVGDRVLNSPFRCWPAGKINSEWVKTFVGGNGVDGVLAEQLVYPSSALALLPKHFSFFEGATLTIAGLTAWAAVVTHGKTNPGDWVLVHGTGGVSMFALQIARMLGARTILSSSNAAKAELLKAELDVSVVIDYRNQNWPQEVLEVTGGHGVDVVVEVAGGHSLGKSIQSSAYGGRVSLVGVLDGVKSTINLRDIFTRQVTVKGILMESMEELRAVVRAYDVTKVRPYISHVFSFDQTKQAYEYLEECKHIGKVVIGLKDTGETNVAWK